MLPMVRAAERAGHEVRVATVGPSWAESWAANTAV